MKRGRPAFWLNENDFVEKNKLLINQPPICICGSKNNYRFGIDSENNINAKCNMCDAWARYLSDKQKWIFYNPWVPLK